MIHFTFFHFTSQPTCDFGFAGGGGRWREDMASRGEGVGKESARLGGNALGTERARLARGGFWDQFYKRNPLKRDF